MRAGQLVKEEKKTHGTLKELKIKGVVEYR